MSQHPNQFLLSFQSRLRFAPVGDGGALPVKDAGELARETTGRCGTGSLTGDQGAAEVEKHRGTTSVTEAVKPETPTVAVTRARSSDGGAASTTGVTEPVGPAVAATGAGSSLDALTLTMLSQKCPSLSEFTGETEKDEIGARSSDGGAASTTGVTEPVGHAVAATGAGSSLDVLALTMLSQQCPSLSKFTGETEKDETEGVAEWLEQLELVGTTCGWVKLVNLITRLQGPANSVNLVTRLRGPAYSFYQSCTAEQRSSYQLLAAALKKRFTPVYLRSARRSQFHKRKQEPNESVDTFVQELRKFYYEAYPVTQQRSPDSRLCIFALLEEVSSISVSKSLIVIERRASSQTLNPLITMTELATGP